MSFLSIVLLCLRSVLAFLSRSLLVSASCKIKKTNGRVVELHKRVNRRGSVIFRVVKTPHSKLTIRGYEIIVLHDGIIIWNYSSIPDCTWLPVVNDTRILDTSFTTCRFSGISSQSSEKKIETRCHSRSNTILADPLQRTLGKEAKIKDTFLMFNLLAKQLFTM